MSDSLLNYYKDKRVFVTGHTGFKGSWLCSILLTAGAQVYGYALAAPEEENLFDKLQLNRRMISTLGDIRDFGRLESVFDEARPEIVFHLAAQPLVRLSYSEPVETFSTNIMGTIHLLEALRNSEGVKACVVVTTDKVYENNGQTRGYAEEDRLGGRDPYSVSKACSEFVTKCYNKSYFENESSAAVATARAGNVIGGGDYAKDRIIPDCIRAARRNETIIVRNPYSVRPWQHVLEPLSGYMLLAEKLAGGCVKTEKAFNFGPEPDDLTAVGELTDIFCKCWGDKLRWEHRSEDCAPHEASVLLLDSTKAKKTLGWGPKLNARQAVKLTVEWERSADKLATSERQIEQYFESGGIIE